jgi:TP901 family phage tail tape measure protein
MNAATMMVIIGANTTGLNKGISDMYRLKRAVSVASNSMNTSLMSTNAALLGLGRTLSMFISIPLGVAGIASSKVFAEFEFSVAKITGLVGIATEQAKIWADEILNMSSAVAKGPQELIDALYFITSSGFKGSESMKILESSAQAASAGLGETKNVADIVTSALNAYGKAHISASEAVDVLTMSVREGKGEPPELVRAFATIIPIASKLGVSFDQVGGALAAMTRLGIPAATASTYLRQTLFTLLKPSKKTRDGLEAIGSSAQKVRDSLKQNGLIDTIIMLDEATRNLNEEGLAEIFPNIRAFMGVTSLVNESLGETMGVFENVKNSAGATAFAFETASNTLKFKWNSALAEGKVLLIKFGEAISRSILPIIETLGSFFERIGNWFNGLSRPLQDTIIKIAGLVFVLGPLELLLAGIGSVLRPIVQLLGNFKTILLGGANNVIFSSKAQSAAASVAHQLKLEEEGLAMATEAEAKAAAHATKSRVVLTGAQKAAAAQATAEAAQAAAAAAAAARVRKMYKGDEFFVGGVTKTKASSDLAKVKLVEANAIKASAAAQAASVIATEKSIVVSQKATVAAGLLARAKDQVKFKTEGATLARNASILANTKAAKAAERLAQAELIHAAAQSKNVLTDSLGLRSASSLQGAYTKQGRAISTNLELHNARRAAMKASALATSLEIAAIDAETAATSAQGLAERLTIKSKIASKEASRANAVASGVARKAKILETESIRAQTAAQEAQRVILEAQALAYGKAVTANKAYMMSTGATYKTLRQGNNARLAEIYIAGKAARATAEAAKKAAEAAEVAKKSAIIVNTSTKSWSTFMAGLSMIPKIPALIVIGSLILLIAHLIKKSRELTEIQQAQKDMSEKLGEAVANETSEVQAYLKIANNEYLARKVREEAIRKINELAPIHLGNLKLETLNTNEARRAIEAYNRSANERLAIEVYEALVKDAYVQHQKDVATGVNREITLRQKLNLIFAQGADPMQILLEKGKDWLHWSKEFGDANAKISEIKYNKLQDAYKGILTDINYVTKATEDWDFAQIQINKVNEEQAKLEQMQTGKLKVSKEERVKQESKYRDQVYNTITVLEDLNSTLDLGIELERKKYTQDETLAKKSVIYKKAIGTKNEIAARDDYNNYSLLLSKKQEKANQTYNMIRSYTSKHIDSMNALYKKLELPTGGGGDGDTGDNIQKSITEIWKNYKATMDRMYAENDLFTENIEDTISKFERLKPSIIAAGNAFIGFGAGFSFDSIIDGVIRFKKNLDNLTNTTAYDFIIKQSEETKKAIDDLLEKKMLGGVIDQKKFDSLVAFYKQIKDVANVAEVWKSVMVDMYKSSLDTFESEEEGILSYKSAEDQVLAITALVGKGLLEVDQIAKDSGSTFSSAAAKVEIYNNSVQQLRALQRKLIADKTGFNGAVLAGIQQELSNVSYQETLLAVDNMTSSMSELNNKMKLLGDFAEADDSKLSILKSSLRSLMDVNTKDLLGDPERLAEWVKETLETADAVDILTKKLQRAGMMAQEFSSMFFKIGEAMVNSTPIWWTFMDTVLNVLQQVITELLVVAMTALLMHGTIKGGLIGLAVAAIAIGALTAMWAKYKSEIESENAEKEKSAKGGMVKGGIVPQGYPNDTYPAMLTTGEMVFPKNRVKELMGIINDKNNNTSKIIREPIPLPKMVLGGIVPQGYPNDSYPARLTSGEMVVPPMKLPEFERQEVNVNVTVEGKTRGQDLYYVIKEVERRYKNSY